MSLCIAAAGKLTVLAVTAFTLSWTHSVEKIAWTEHWRVTRAGLVVEEARVEGSGAGMEPPADAVFDGSGWIYHPHVPPQGRVALGDSGEAGAWRLCTGDGCLSLGGAPGGGQPIVLSTCP
jgi:hypothetical protein